MPKAVEQALNRPGERENQPDAAAQVVEHDACNHQDKVTRIEPEEFGPGILRPPMLLNLFYKASAQKRLVQDVNNVRGDHEPERKDQRDVHIVKRLMKPFRHVPGFSFRFLLFPVRVGVPHINRWGVRLSRCLRRKSAEIRFWLRRCEPAGTACTLRYYKIPWRRLRKAIQ